MDLKFKTENTDGVVNKVHKSYCNSVSVPRNILPLT